MIDMKKVNTNNCTHESFRIVGYHATPRSAETPKQNVLVYKRCLGCDLLMVEAISELKVDSAGKLNT